MDKMGQILTVLVAMEQVYIAWVEMFSWETMGRKTFEGIPETLFPPSKMLAANQSLYNLFLSAGLFWSMVIGNPDWAVHVRLFFLGCVTVAGVFGALTAGKKLFFMQALPALITMLLTCYL